MRVEAALPALTHHEILALVEPFVRAGHRPDLAASDRTRRRIVFHPQVLAPVPSPDPQAGSGSGTESDPGPRTAAPKPPGASPMSPMPKLTQALVLEQPAPQRCTLTRRVTTPDGLEACVELEGADAGALLRRLQDLTPQQQFGRADGALVAWQQRLPLPVGDAPPPVLRGAQARVAGLTLAVRVSGVGGYPAEIELLRGEGPAPRLPDDLLAVLGGPWSHLTPLKRGWIGSIALRGEEPRRSALAQARLTQTVAHLSRTLAEPPPRFHERHRRARWIVGLRGTLPVLLGLGIVGAALYAQRLGPEGQSTLAMLANATPPLLLMLLFLRKEIPRIGLPRVPRRLAPDAWEPAAAAGLQATRVTAPR
jgi:hypothetical protein